jgi:hypothetical protein
MSHPAAKRIAKRTIVRRAWCHNGSLRSTSLGYCSKRHNVQIQRHLVWLIRPFLKADKADSADLRESAFICGAFTCAFCASLWLVKLAALLRDRAARDPGAGVAGRIRLHVVSLLMNHERCATVAEQRV